MAELESSLGKFPDLALQSVEVDGASVRPPVAPQSEPRRAWAVLASGAVLLNGQAPWKPHGNTEASTAVSEIVQEAQPNGLET
jgi:hypothetical protein